MGSKWTCLRIALITLMAFLLSACGQKVNFDKGATDAASTGSSQSYGGTDFSDVKQTIHVNTTDDIDILFVVDNSGSMGEEQSNISSKIDGFISQLKGLNWNIALTTTDPNFMTTGPDGDKHRWGDGLFRPFTFNGTQYEFLKSDESSPSWVSEAQSMISSALYVGTWGSDDERAINATYRAIERMSDQASHQDFFRMDSKLAVVAISDEDECSDGDCLSYSPKSDPQNLLALVHSTFGAQKVFSFNSIIKATDDTHCWSAAQPGATYQELSEMTGGVIGSICANDYTPILSDIGQNVLSLMKSVNLQCVPIDTDGDAQPDMHIVSQDGTLLTSGYSIRGTTVTFDSSLPEGDYTFYYSCAR